MKLSVKRWLAILAVASVLAIAYWFGGSGGTANEPASSGTSATVGAPASPAAAEENDGGASAVDRALPDSSEYDAAEAEPEPADPEQAGAKAHSQPDSRSTVETPSEPQPDEGSSASVKSSGPAPAEPGKTREGSKDVDKEAAGKGDKSKDAAEGESPARPAPAEAPSTGAGKQPAGKTPAAAASGSGGTVKPADPKETKGKDSYLTEPVPEGKPEPVEWQQADVDKKRAFTATLSVDSSTILDHLDQFNADKLEVLPDDGVIFAAQKVTFYEGESVFDVLLREMKRHKIHMEFEMTPLYNSNYIEGIHNIYEFDCGELSGWMYRVNGWFPNYGASRYQLQDGDVIEWLYTCDLGRDIGGGQNDQGGK